MKANEIILNEGPLDFAKKVGAGFAGLANGGLAGAKAAYGAQDAANNQADKTNAIVSKAVQQWNTTAAQMKQGGQEPTADQAVAWMTKFLGKAPSTKPADASPANISKFISTEINKHIADRAAQGLNGTPAKGEPAPAASAPAAAASAPAQGQQATTVAPPKETWKYQVPGSDSVYDVGINDAGKLTINMDGEWETVDDADDSKAIMATKPQAGQAQTGQAQTGQAQATPPAKPDANAFAEKLKSDFAAFADAGGATGGPAVRQVLKSLWMQSGGTKAESKKNPKKPV